MLALMGYSASRDFVSGVNEAILSRRPRLGLGAKVGPASVEPARKEDGSSVISTKHIADGEEGQDDSAQADVKKRRSSSQ